MNLPNPGLERGIIVFTACKHTDVTAGRQTPIAGFNLAAVHDLYQPWHGSKFSVGESIVQPGNLPVKVDGSVQRLDCLPSLFVELL